MNAIDQYIAAFPKETQRLLEQIRATIRKAAPHAEEKIGYGIPTLTLEGNLVHFAGYKNHIGFYPGAAGIATFKKELSVYKGAKGSVQFPVGKPLPLALVTKIVKFRVEQNLEKAARKNLRTCRKGHTYYKSSDCPTCPVCEQERKPKDGFLALLSAPARRALENKGIATLKQLAACSEAEILKLHGMGPASLPKLHSALKGEGLSFKKA
ncbi:MAG: hypothetical protein FD123_4188 [Bacteroidetes bacterium]|nr:MAG: hypothetical protein FD123_4188 [Bacteroidota bacterium]